MEDDDQRPETPPADVARVARLARVTGKARADVVERTGAGLTDPEAEAFVRKKLAAITLDVFYKTYRDQPTPADVYGIIDGYGGWWLKVAMVNGQAVVISCHEPLGNMRLRGGRVLPGKGKT